MPRTAARGRAAPRPWGQHFLRSGALASRLVDLGPFAAGTTVLEIGAGLGALTRPLAARGCRVLAVEVDPALASGLAETFAGEEHVTVVEADVLDLPLLDRPHVVAGNIPFGLTAEIVQRMTSAPSPPDDLYLVVQREAAERFAGAPYAPESLASLRLKPWWHAEIGLRLRPHDFEPPPTVEAAVLWLARRPRPLVAAEEREAYLGFLAATFGRGRTMRQALNRAFTPKQLARLSRDLGFRLDARPSEVDFARWLALYRASAMLAPEPSKRRVRGAAGRRGAGA